MITRKWQFSHVLRDYQITGLDEIRASFRQGIRRVLLHMGVGSGKTATFCEILKLAHAKGTPALVVVRGRKLISQAAARLKREGVPHGIIMAGREGGEFENIRVCSIDTLHRRRFAPKADLIIIDEAHQTAGEAYKWFLDQYPTARILGVTATPYLKRGLRHIADKIVWPITVQKLTEQGYLVPLLYWTPETPDLEGVSTSGDDFNQRELGVAMRKAALAGNIVKTYLEQGGSRRAVLFAVDVEHSLQLVEQFRGAGVPAAHIDARNSDQERDEAIGSLERQEIKVLCNVGILTTGVDIPAVELIIMARPTKSYCLFIQMLGRGTRTAHQKTDCFVFDHAGNVYRHGLLEHEREANLDGLPPKEGPQVKQCPSCFAWCGQFESVCPACGKPFQDKKPAQRNKETDDDVSLKPYTVQPWQDELLRLTAMGKSAGYKPGFIYHRMKNIYGDLVAKEAWKALKRREPEWLAASKTKSTNAW